MALSPGERVDLKKRIAETLGQQEWRHIDLTLSEFGFPVSDQWRGDERSDYVLEMLGPGAADGDLAELDGYLHPTDAPSAPPQPEAFDDPADPWSGQGLRLFLTHHSDYRGAAATLREELAKRSVDAFVAHDSIEPGEEWENVIISALRSCDACLALLTPGFKESPWADQEVGFCMARSGQERGSCRVVALWALEVAEDGVDREIAHPFGVALVAPPEAEPVDQRLEQHREDPRGRGRIPGADGGVQAVLHFALDFHGNSIPTISTSATGRARSPTGCAPRS